MNGTGTYSDDERRRLQSMGKPRLADRIQDDPLARDAPYEADQAPSIEPPAPGGMTFQDQPPPQPRLAQRVLGGFEGQPGGGTGGLVGRVARGALSGALGPTQRQDIESERLGSQRISGELATGAQRIGGEEALESQREAYGLPEQRARIAQQSAQTAQERLSTMILQQQLEMMNRGDIYAGNYTDEQKAYINSEMALRGPKGAADAIRAVQQQNAIAGRIGPGTNVYDPNAPGGVSREFMTRGGQPMPGATVRGAVVPGTLPRAETSEQLVPTAGGGMVAVGKTSTVTPQVPGAPRQGGGGGGVRELPVQPRMPGMEQRTRDTAGVALQAIPDIATQLGQLRDKLELGPLQGRIQEIRRSIGNADPTYVQLKTNIHLLVSALSVMHFGARGNWQWLQDFSRNADAGAMNYDDLRAGLGVMEKWIRRYQKIGDQGNVDEGVSAPGAGRAAGR